MNKKIFFEKKAQGAIEYLLIIGVVILIAAGLIIALSGLASLGTKSTQEDTYTYKDAKTNLKTEHIGLKFVVKGGEHESLVIEVLPKDPKLGVVFSGAPVGTKIRLNYGDNYEKENNGVWSNGGNEVELKRNDVVDIEIPKNAGDYELTLKGGFVKREPQKIVVSCDGGQVEAHTIDLIYFPLKEEKVSVLFKDLFNEPKKGSELSGLFKGNWYGFKSIETCKKGILCENLNEMNCGSKSSYFCDWNEGEEKCVVNEEYDRFDYFGITDCEDVDFLTLNDYYISSCEQLGCEINKFEFDERAKDKLIGVGDDLVITCGVDQTLNAVLEEDVGVEIDPIEEILFEKNWAGYNIPSQIFKLKNYYCYDFNKIYNKISEQVEIGTSWNVYLKCYKGEDYVNWNYSKSIHGTIADSVVGNKNLKMYGDTLCYLSSNFSKQGTLELNPIVFDCE